MFKVVFRNTFVWLIAFVIGFFSLSTTQMNRADSGSIFELAGTDKLGGVSVTLNTYGKPGCAEKECLNFLDVRMEKGLDFVLAYDEIGRVRFLTVKDGYANRDLLEFTLIDSIVSASLIGNNGTSIFAVEYSDTKQKWGNARYSSAVKEDSKSFQSQGEHYLDIDFNGQMDYKHVYNGESEIKEKYIYYESKWFLISWFDETKSEAGVFVDGEEFVFEFKSNLGWLPK